MLSFFLLFSLVSNACDDGFIKRNNFKIPVISHLANDLDESTFKKTIRKFESFFMPYIESEHRAELQVIGSWFSSNVNAYADQKDNKWLITIYGGIARHKAISIDGLNLILCHELGHHMGGYPKKGTNKWSSAEGQSDYYATMKCLRKLWQNEDNHKKIKDRLVPQTVKDLCYKSFTSNQDRSLCQRMSLAGKSVALMIQDLDHDSIEPMFNTPDTSVVRSINYMHPYAQCRLDTLFQGSICPVHFTKNFSDDDEVLGSCHSRNGHSIGIRPRCWFAPLN